ncbi:MAG: CidA/LrgA family protein [Lachnospiraceae bacterium]|nr:CidA/LrgA family protein [Lachnospiraceae bacterium]
MKYLRQFFIILAFSFAGEVLHALIPMQVPASIYGLVLLFIALLAGWVKLPQIRETANLLITMMPLMFIPAGVGLLESWGELRTILLPVCVIVVVSTILVMGISGMVTQAMIRKSQKNQKNGNS